MGEGVGENGENGVKGSFWAKCLEIFRPLGENHENGVVLISSTGG